MKKRREAEPDDAEFETELLDDNDLIEVATPRRRRNSAISTPRSPMWTGCWRSAAPREI